MRLSTILPWLRSRLIYPGLPVVDTVSGLRLLSVGLGLGIIGCLLLGCGQSPGSTASGAALRDATVALPTEVPTQAPSPVNTRIPRSRVRVKPAPVEPVGAIPAVGG